jgi:hypothetical protein
MPTNAPDSLILICTATVAASDAIGTVDTVTITDDQAKTGVTDYYIPTGNNFVITSLSVQATADYGTSDPSVVFWKGAGKIIVTTLPLSNFLNTVVNKPRFAPKPVRYKAGDKLWLQTKTNIANDTIADSIRFFLAVEVQQA